MDKRYWNNCGFFLNDSTQFIIPEEAGALHGMERKTFSWPTWRNLNLSFFRNNPEPIGLYMLDAREPFFGYYDHGEGFGLALGNENDEVLLMSDSGALVDSAAWGGGPRAGVTPFTDFTPPFPSDGALRRYPAGIDRDDCSVDFYVTYTPRPGEVEGN